MGSGGGGAGWILVASVLIAGCAEGGQGPGASDSAFTVGPPMPSSNGVAGGPGSNGMGAAGRAGGMAPTTPGASGMSGGITSGGAGTGGASGGVAIPPGGQAGAGAAGSAPMATAGSGGAPMPAPPGSTDPIIPAVSGECPTFRDGTISFMGLGGIALRAGSKPSSPTAPMIFYWHGTGGSAGEYALQAGAVASGAAAEGGVLVSFNGTTGGDLLSGTFIFGAGDFELTDQLVACGVRDHNVDPRRIFATGCSAGGLFSGGMAAARSNYMAAVAPNSGGWTVPVMFQNDNTPALMTIHGAPGVDVVAVDFSVTSATADGAFKNRGGFVINCNHGGIHCGGGGLAGDIWKFFQAHPFGTKPSPWASGLPAGFSSVCKIF
jgi:hypothetical protein